LGFELEVLAVPHGDATLQPIRTVLVPRTANNVLDQVLQKYPFGNGDVGGNKVRREGSRKRIRVGKRERDDDFLIFPAVKAAKVATDPL